MNEEHEEVLRKRNRSNGVTDHIVLEGESRTLCNHVTVKTTVSGKVNKAYVHDFKGLDSGDMWCSKCRSRFEELRE